MRWYNPTMGVMGVMGVWGVLNAGCDGWGVLNDGVMVGMMCGAAGLALLRACVG